MKIFSKLGLLALVLACATLCTFGQTIKLSTPKDFEQAANEWQLRTILMREATADVLRQATVCIGGVARPDDPDHCWSQEKIAAYKAKAEAARKALIAEMQAKYGRQFSDYRDLRKKAHQ